MNVCDLCNLPLSQDSTRYSASQIRKAVRAGLRPNSTSIELGAAFGMSKEDTITEWKKRVMTDNTDWCLCPSCSSKYAQCEVKEFEHEIRESDNEVEDIVRRPKGFSFMTLLKVMGIFIVLGIIMAILVPYFVMN
jgi:hypothetical protein